MKKLSKALTLALLVLTAPVLLLACFPKTYSQNNNLQINEVWQDEMGELAFSLTADTQLDSTIYQYIEISINGGDWLETYDYGKVYNNTPGKYQTNKDIYETVLMNLVGQTVTIDARLGKYKQKNTTYLASPGLLQKQEYFVKDCLTFSEKLSVGVVENIDANIVDLNSTQPQTLDMHQLDLYFKNPFVDEESEHKYFKYVIFKDHNTLLIKEVVVTITQDESETKATLQLLNVAQNTLSYTQINSGTFDYHANYSWTNIENSALPITSLNTSSAEDDNGDFISIYLRLNETQATTHSILNKTQPSRIYL